MDSYSYYFLFHKCQTHAYTRFENGCSENSTQKLLTKYSTEEKNKQIICRPRSVRIRKNCALGLEYGPRPVATGRTQDLWHSFCQNGPPGRQIAYIYWQLPTRGFSVTIYNSRGKQIDIAHIAVYNCFLQIKTNVGFWWEGKTGVPGEEPLIAE